jgi:hypothetical protein
MVASMLIATSTQILLYNVDYGGLTYTVDEHLANIIDIKFKSETNSYNSFLGSNR